MSTEIKNTALESYFNEFRENIVGIDQEFATPYGIKKIVYADWTASGRLYKPLEDKMLRDFGPYVANTHTETTISGTVMTKAYKEARVIIKKHVNADLENDVFLPCGTGMTGAINKLQRILGLKVSENLKDYTNVPDELRPVIFISHMEHHSNQTSWLETIAKVVVVPSDEKGLFSLKELKKLLIEYSDTPIKIASVTACSNVTGLTNPYFQIAEIMHANDGLCFVDFACSAPYQEIDMHPEDFPNSNLDAIFFSPHKFLGGPGTNGVLIFNKKMYHNLVPDCPGGGTVSWTTPWGDHRFFDDIEDREDGGTPGFLQVIRTALSIRLKEKMSVDKIMKREEELVTYVFERFKGNEKIKILAGDLIERFGVFSILIGNLHHELAVKILNDRFGIQTRGGCSCAGTYGHYLLQIDHQKSDEIIGKLEDGTCELKPGWVRFSIHPTTSNHEIKLICDGILAVSENYKEWGKDYHKVDGKYTHKNEKQLPINKSWFDF